MTVAVVPQTLLVQLQLYRAGESAVRYLGETEIRIGEWTVAGFDIKNYARAASGADQIRLSLIGGDGTTDITYTLSLNEIRYDTGAGFVVLRVFLVILVILGLAVAVFFLLVLRAQIIRRRRRRQRAAQRAAYLARQREMQMRAMQAQQVPQQMPSKQMHTANPPKAGQQGQPTQGNPTVRRGAQRRPDMYQNQNRSDRR